MNMVNQLFPGIGTFFAEDSAIAVARLFLILLGFILAYMGFTRKLEPLIMVPMGIGMICVNAGQMFLEGNVIGTLILNPLVSDPLELVDTLQVNFLQPIYNLTFSNGLIACLVFMGIGARSEISFLLSMPWTSVTIALLAELGTFAALIMGVGMLGLSPEQAASIATIGGADGPTSLFLCSKLGQTQIMGPIAVAAYSYMSLVPIIQPPIMKLCTTEKERKIKMDQLRPVSKLEKILFPIVITIVVCLILPTTAPLVGMLMLGNLFRECGVVKQLTETASNALMYIVVILLGTSVGASTSAEAFLNADTLKIVVLGLVAFAIGTFGGCMLGKLLCKLTHGKINPLIGSAGVSAVPMAARVSQKVGAEADPTNFLLMHAMGPNVAGVIGTAVAAGTFMAIFGV